MLVTVTLMALILMGLTQYFVQWKLVALFVEKEVRVRNEKTAISLLDQLRIPLVIAQKANPLSDTISPNFVNAAAKELF